MAAMRWFIPILLAVGFAGCPVYEADPVVRRHPLPNPAEETEANTAADDLGSDIATKISEILNANMALDAGLCYRTLFAEVGIEGLEALRNSHHDSIAIQAAWEEVALTVPEEEGPEVYRPDQQKLNWFHGFVAGRARVSMPSWWTDVVLDARAHRRDNIFPGSPTEEPYHKAGLKYVRAPCDTKIEQVGDGLVLHVRDESIRIPEWGITKYYRHVSALFTPECCYIAVHDDRGHPYTLACVDRSSAEIVWRAEVWGSWWGHSTGVGRAWVTVTEQNDRVVVFGAASTGIHVEAFQSSDGKNVFRFSSSY